MDDITHLLKGEDVVMIEGKEDNVTTPYMDNITPLLKAGGPRCDQGKGG